MLSGTNESTAAFSLAAPIRRRPGIVFQPFNRAPKKLVLAACDLF
jgi:hypothetical protein